LALKRRYDPDSILNPGFLPVRGDAMDLTSVRGLGRGARAPSSTCPSEYRNAAAKWGDGFNGNILLVFDADATLRDPRAPRRAGQRLCAGLRFVEGVSHPAAGFGLARRFGV
jgi:hypothetical protein